MGESTLTNDHRTMFVKGGKSDYSQKLQRTSTERTVSTQFHNIKTHATCIHLPRGTTKEAGRRKDEKTTKDKEKYWQERVTT